MSKRAPDRFKRRKGDFYPTPPKAIWPVIPFLEAEGIRTFAEPCDGNGAMRRELESHGFKCVHSGDKNRGQDALLQTDFNNAERIITNPPHTREFMHPLILHLCSIAPTWLLIDSDWAQTQQSAPFMKLCTTIVSIGRVRWIENSESDGLDNFSWYRFDAKNEGPTIFQGRTPKEKK
jgi:hypothetical protein